MTLMLDIRAPLIVLVADFNPAIFQAPWIAKHLFGKAEGEQVALAEVLIQNGPVLVPLTFLEGVSINVGPNRTEFFALDTQPKTLELVECVLLRMLEALPHTPLSAIGCNLSYIDDNPSEAIEEMFKTPEGFEAEGELNVRQSVVQLKLWSEPFEVVHPLCWSEDQNGWSRTWPGSVTSPKRSSPSCVRLTC
jgi:hypothetical protein